MSKKSAGLLLFRDVAGTVEVLLVHPGGPFWTKKDEGAWSIPKGEFSDDEDPFHAALREFEEEMGGAVTGDFIAGKEGLTSTGDVMDVLRMLRTFADRIESESPSAANAFASTYMHDGKTKADWQAQLAALFAAYDSLHVTIDAVKQIFTFNDADVHPMVLAPPRVEWHLSVTGVPAGGGPVATVLDLTSAFAGDPQLFWIGYEGGNAVFVGNGYTSPFSISMPVQPGDSARSVYGLWPLYVHGGGHPEGHPGWDVEFAAGAKVRASADGVIDQIVPNLTFPGQVDVRVKHRPGITTQYGHIGALEPGPRVGAPRGVPSTL